MPDALSVRLGDLLEGAAEGLARSSVIPEPRREALQLAATVLDRSPAAVLLARGEPIDPAQADAVRVAVARRAAGEPMVYVTEVAGFRHLDLYCDARALIPRPETETLVDLVLERVRTGVAVDVGTGSGCLALSLAGEGDFEAVLAVDRSGEALHVARQNVRSLGSGVQLVQGDLMVMLAEASVDAVVSNPPYLTEEEYRTLDPSVRDWEPREALVSGPDGLEATARLLAQARLVLRPGGWVALEVDATRANEVARLADAEGLDRVRIQQDVFARNRYVLAQRRA